MDYLIIKEMYNYPFFKHELHILTYFQRSQYRKGRSNCSTGKAGKRYLCQIIKVSINNNRLVPNWKRSTSRLYIVTLAVLGFS